MERFETIHVRKLDIKKYSNQLKQKDQKDITSCMFLTVDDLRREGFNYVKRNQSVGMETLVFLVKQK